MLTIPQYLIESSFCLLLFYGFYHLFLSRETFFQINRAYLIGTPILSLGIPLINISFKKDAPTESLEALFYPAIQSANNLNDLVWEQMRAPTPVFSLTVADLIMAAYLVGVFLMSFSLLKGLWNLSRLIKKGKQSKNKEFTLIETENNFPAASFFGYIFWNQQITDEQKLILEHEKVHIRQWHSLDVLLMEICVIIKWFNPLIYWFRNALKATHEYIADQFVIQQKSNIRDYAALLVQQQQQNSPTPLTNTFYSLTKNRLKMMLQQPSQKINAGKYLGVFPLIMALMLLFSFNLIEEIPQVSEGLAEMNTVLNVIGHKVITNAEKKTILYNKKNKEQQTIEQLSKIFPFFYYNQLTLSKPQNEGNKYTYHLEKYKELSKRYIKKGKATKDFGKAGGKGIFATYLQIKGKELRQSNFKKNSPLQLVFFGDTFYFMTHKLSFENFDHNNFLGKESYASDSGLAKWFGESGKNGVVITRLAATTHFERLMNKDKKSYSSNQSSLGNIDTYELKWGNHLLPIIYNKETNGTVARFITKKDFFSKIRNPFLFYKNGQLLEYKRVKLTLFDSKNGSSWGIDKMGGEKYKYWDFLKGDYAHFELNTSKKQSFTKAEIDKIETLLNEGWLLTFRAEDDFQLYTSISIVEPSSILLIKQYEPIPKGIPNGY